MKTWMRVSLLLLIVSVLCAASLAVATPVRAVSGLAPLPRTAPVAPKLTAKAALVREDSEGQVLMSKAADMPMPTASTIKMLAAITALRIGQPTDTVETIKADLVGGSTMNLKAGDTLTLGNLLQGLLIPSGNDAAMAIARLEGTKLPAAAQIGAVPAFVAKMNEVGLSLGLKGTKAINPHGLDPPGQISLAPASDLALLADAVLADPVLAPIVRTKEAKIPSRLGTYPVTNTNELLGTPGVIGVKTGTDDLAGQNLVLAVNEGNHRLTVVVMGSSDRFTEARALLAYVRANWAWLTLGDAKATPGLARALDAWGVAVVPEGRKTVLFDKPTAARVRYRLVLEPGDTTPDSPGPVPTIPGTAIPPTTPGTTASAISGTKLPDGTTSAPVTRGVIIYLLGDREVGRLNLVAASPVVPVPSPTARP